MSLEYSFSGRDFFDVLNDVVREGIEIAHECFKLVVVKFKNIPESEYDYSEGEKGIIVGKFSISDGTGSLRIEGFAYSATPSLSDLPTTINIIKQLTEHLGLYSYPPFPDEDLQAQITIESTPLTLENFEVSVSVSRTRNGAYEGLVVTEYRKILRNREEARSLIER
jgi:hypothetical protein